MSFVAASLFAEFEIKNICASLKKGSPFEMYWKIFALFTSKQEQTNNNPKWKTTKRYVLPSKMNRERIREDNKSAYTHGKCVS